MRSIRSARSPRCAMAICRCARPRRSAAYIDLAFDGPPLIPRDPTGAARTEQWISMVNTGFDLTFARQYLRAYFFSGLPDGAPDRATIDAALPKMREMFALLDRELGTRALSRRRRLHPGRCVPAAADPLHAADAGEQRDGEGLIASVRLVRSRRRTAECQGDRTAADARPRLIRAHHDRTVTIGGPVAASTSLAHAADRSTREGSAG